MNEVRKAFCAPGDRMARMVHFLRRIPKDIKFKIRRLPVMGLLKMRDTRLHDLLGHIERQVCVNRVSAGPEIRPDLITGNLAPGPDGLVVVSAFQHRKSRPPIHGLRRRNEGTNTNQHTQRFYPHCHLYLADYLPKEKDKVIKYNKHCLTIIACRKLMGIDDLPKE